MRQRLNFENHLKKKNWRERLDVPRSPFRAQARQSVPASVHTLARDRRGPRVRSMQVCLGRPARSARWKGGV